MTSAPQVLELAWRCGPAADAGTVAFLADGNPVWLSARLAGMPAGARVEFRLQARNARGNLTWWRRVATLVTAVSVDAGSCAAAEWRMANGETLTRWAFATFRFSLTVRDAAGRRLRLAGRTRSGPLRHYATLVGFYGLGPVGERFSNAVIGRLVHEWGGVALRRRSPGPLRRLAAQVPRGERGMRLFGYSLGGRAAVRLARELARRGVEVAQLVGVDPVHLRGRPLRVPGNVRRAVNFFQRNGGRAFFLPGHAGRGTRFAAEEDAVTIVENIEVQDGADRRRVAHEDMPGYVFEALREELAAGGSALVKF